MNGNFEEGIGNSTRAKTGDGPPHHTHRYFTILSSIWWSPETIVRNLSELITYDSAIVEFKTPYGITKDNSTISLVRIPIHRLGQEDYPTIYDYSFNFPSFETDTGEQVYSWIDTAAAKHNLRLKKEPEKGIKDWCYIPEIGNTSYKRFEPLVN